MLFFTFGFVTWLNGSLIPFLKIACELSQAEAYLVSLAFYISYTVLAMPMSAVLLRTGYKNGMVLGLLCMAVGALIFIPAAHLRVYAVFLIGLLVMGAGLTILRTAANPYIVVIGPRENAAVGSSPEFDLVRDISAHVKIPVVAEGRVWTPEQAKMVIESGAFAVYVGTAITRPVAIVEKFVAALITR